MYCTRRKESENDIEKNSIACSPGKRKVVDFIGLLSELKYLILTYVLFKVKYPVVQRKWKRSRFSS